MSAFANTIAWIAVWLSVSGAGISALATHVAQPVQKNLPYEFHTVVAEHGGFAVVTNLTDAAFLALLDRLADYPLHCRGKRVVNGFVFIVFEYDPFDVTPELLGKIAGWPGVIGLIPVSIPHPYRTAANESLATIG